MTGNRNGLKRVSVVFEPCWITRMVWCTQYILQWQEEPRYCQVQTDIFYLVLMRNISQEIHKLKPQPHSQNGRRQVDPWCEESSALWGCRSFHQSLQLGLWGNPDKSFSDSWCRKTPYRGGELSERSFRNQFELRPVLLKTKMQWYSKPWTGWESLFLT